jgi:hypothetical protein
MAQRESGIQQTLCRKSWIPGSACGRPGMTVQPLPTNGIWFAITVMNSTLVESGRPAM